MEAQIEKQLDKILPEDLARTFESAYHVFLQGNHDHMDDLLKHGGTLLRKAAQRFSPTQMVVGLTAIAALTIVIIARSNDDHEGEAHDLSARKPQLGGNKDQNKGGSKGQGDGQDRDDK